MAITLSALVAPPANAAIELPIATARERAATFAESTCTHDQSCVRSGVLNCRRDSLHIVFCRIFLRRRTPVQGTYDCNRLIRLALDPETRRVPVTGLGRWHCG